MPRSLEFYREVLGFSVVFTNGLPVSFAVLRQDAARIHLSLRPELAGSTHTHVLLSDLDAFHEMLMAAGVAVGQPPKIQSWGLRDIVVADGDGNTFEFAEVVSKASAV
jgi:catechol 2,3-dioxygenase-like lactoylglutathione lyase family enzyme